MIAAQRTSLMAVAQPKPGVPVQNTYQAAVHCLDIPPSGSVDEVVGEPPADLDFSNKAVSKREERSRFGWQNSLLSGS